MELVRKILCIAGGAAALLSHSLAAAEVRVFAAASLTDVLEELAPLYKTESGETLAFNFAGSNILARQIAEGAPADIFLSADEAQMDVVAHAGLLLPGSRTEVLANSLVLIVPRDAASIRPADLATPAVARLALADPRSVPAGVYAREYLTKAGIWQAVAPKVVPVENVRAALAAVESGNVNAGIVYKTDAAISKEVRVVFEVPAKESPSITYPGAVLADTAVLDAAKRFLAWLGSPAAVKVFKKYGFLSVPK